jgi:hypothetical protein
MQKEQCSNAPTIKRRHRTLARQRKLIAAELRHIPKLVVVSLISISASKNDLGTARLLALTLASLSIIML